MGDDSDSDLDLDRAGGSAAPVKAKKDSDDLGSAGSDLSVQRKRRKPKKAKAVKAERPKVEPKIEDDLESGSDVSMERGKRKKDKEKEDVDLLVERAQLKVEAKKPKTKKRKTEKKERDCDSDGSDLQVERPRKDAKIEKAPEEVKEVKEVKQDRELPYSMGFGFKARARDPSRSRDPWDSRHDDKGKGKGKGKGKSKGKEEANDQPKEEPNFEPSGLLALEDNAKNGIPLKYTVPNEARRPATKWRLYVFPKTANEAAKVIPIHKHVGYLFGKDRRIVDVPTDHPTCSKQHAVLHYRAGTGGVVKPYIMDLESVNGTFVNGERIEAARYTELKEKDILKFGMSSREFVLLHGGSANHMEIDPAALRSPEEE